MAEVFITVGADTAHPDSININSGDPYFVKDGTLDMSTPGQIAFRLAVRGVDADTRIASANALFRLLRRAAQAESIGSAITVSMRRGGSAWAHYDLTPAIAETLSGYDLYNGGALAFYDLVLPCYPYARGDAVPVTVAGTLSGATAAFLIPDVPGHLDALAHLELTDTSASGVINRVRATVIRDAAFAAATDYTPWVDVTTLSGATTTVDATDFGGSHAGLTSTSLDWADIARAVGPGGSRARGRFDGYARVWSSGAAIGTPANLAGSVTAPDAITSTESNYAQITVGATGSGRAVSSTDPVATWSGTTTAGSLLLAIGYVQVITPTFSVMPSGGGTWKRLTTLTVTSEAGNEMYLGIYYQRNAAAQSGSVTWDDTVFATSANPSALQLIELQNADLIFNYGGASDTANTNEPTGAAPVASSFVNEMLLSIFTLPTANTTDPTDFWYAGYESLFGGNSMLAGYRIIDSPGTTPTAPKVRLDTTYNAWLNLNLHIKPVKTESSSTVYQEPTPGELETGTYTTRIQAIDAAGYRGNASASITPSVTTARSSIPYTWDAAANATAYALTIQHGARFFEVITTGTSYELTTLDGLKEVAALPGTSGAVAPPPRIRARAGTENDHALTALPDVALSGDGVWELVRLFSNRMLPPIDAPLEDTWANWSVEVQGRSANGATAFVLVDALWVVPCREPGVEAWIQGLNHGTKRRWLLESHRSGKGVFGWLENTGTGAEVGRLTTAGTLLIPPGNSILLLAFEQAAGVHSFGAQVTAQLTLWPRSRWEQE